MRKFLLITLFCCFFVSCDNRFFTGKQVIKINNNSTKDIFVSVDEQKFEIPQNTQKIVEAYADAKIQLDSKYRCKITMTGVEEYSISDEEGYTISVYNGSTRTIILQEKNNYIGSYEEIMVTPSIKIEIPADEIKTFILYTNTPQYKAIYKDNNYNADLSLLSFKKLR